MSTTKKRYWFVFCNEQLLLEKTPEGFTIPFQEEPPIPLLTWTHVHEIEMFEKEPFNAYYLDSPWQENERFTSIGLRASFECLPTDLYLMAGKAYELIFWDRNQRFCPVCGMPMKFNTPISKRCTGCGKELWPTVATAIIVRILKDDEVLLVHGRNFRGDLYGLVAGFVETGETLEECIEREVFEETGLRVKNIRYFASQPWPYPLGLMIGFTADYAEGTVRLQTSELSAGKFFSRENLPEIPGKMSIARMLIDDWLEKK